MGTLFDEFGQVIGGFADHPAVRFTILAAGAYVVLVWLATAFWTFQDLRRRHPDPALPYLAAGGVVVASPLLFPLALVVYRIVRPAETLAERRELDLNDRLDLLEAELRTTCPACGRLTQDDWLACPGCRTRLAHRCAACGRTMGLDWALCGWCGAEFGRPVLADPLRRARTGSERGPLRERPAEAAGA